MAPTNALSIYRRRPGKIFIFYKTNGKIGATPTPRLIKNLKVSKKPLARYIPQPGSVCPRRFIDAQVCIRLTPHNINNTIRLKPFFCNENFSIKRPNQKLLRRASGKSAGKESRNKDKNECKNLFHNAGKLKA